MKSTHQSIADTIGIRKSQITAVASLLAEGATVPFMARYRKERTGNLDEVAITKIRDLLEAAEKLAARKEAITTSLSQQNITDPVLLSAIRDAETLTRLEDLYLPYRPKRRTRATIAKEKGLSPLADLILQQEDRIDPLREAMKFTKKEVPDAASALSGARDIMAESISEDAAIRAGLRDLFFRSATMKSTVCKGKETEGVRFQDYFDHEEPVSRIKGHRILAMLRGERDGILKLLIRPDAEAARNRICRKVIRRSNKSSDEVHKAVADAYQRLLAPGLATEVKQQLRQDADNEAISVFATNLNALLMAAPFGGKPVFAIDPGFRTGCKAVILDAGGNLCEETVLYPFRDAEAAERTVRELLRRYPVSAIAIGNGTAGRETQNFFRNLGLTPPIVMVNEAGASVYSASQVAREEFPHQDVTVRGAVSIGRRLMDPLAELVKIDPKSIGVGQYQHDVDQGLLKNRLDTEVVSCVNRVGVNLNTASASLLSYVAGMGPKLARSVVDYRRENGPFPNRKALLKVPRLGAKTFEQAAGFLRVPESDNPLDASAVHPERYGLVTRMAKDMGKTVLELMQTPALAASLPLSRYETRDVGLPTLRDILSELEKPGRDPRDPFSTFTFADVHKPEDLTPGMQLPGIVTNVTNFGCFVDVGVHQDGLVHISQMADRFVKDPHQIAKPGQTVTVRVLEVDSKRKRIALSMKPEP